MMFLSYRNGIVVAFIESSMGKFGVSLLTRDLKARRSLPGLPVSVALPVGIIEDETANLS